MGYGYRTGEGGVPYPDVKTKENVKFRLYKQALKDPEMRLPVASDLGPTSSVVAVPHPDNNDARNLFEGARKRFLSRPPTGDPELLRRLRIHVKKFLADRLTPLASQTDTTFDTWLENRNYPEWRKQQLREVRKEIDEGMLPKDYHHVKMFGKDENLAEQAKTLRGIHSRTDYFKVLVGPVFAQIDKELFALPEFTKKTPVPDRPEKILHKFNMSSKIPGNSDYTAFETHMVKIIMAICEFELYHYMTQHLPKGEFHEHVHHIIGMNVVRAKWFTLLVEATRMSGEMCTSSGNGFTNLMVGTFAAQEHGATETFAEVEGDDGLFMHNGHSDPTPEWFQRLGFTIKLEYKPLEEASYCGLIFDPDDLINICEPLEAILTVGWASGKYAGLKTAKKMSLLRSKALSMFYQYNGCPILTSLSQQLLRLTRSYNTQWAYNSRLLSQWDRDNLTEAENWFRRMPEVRVPGLGTRLLMERVFKITVEHQLILEEHFSNMETLKDFDHPLLAVYSPSDWVDYAQKYVIPIVEINDLLRPPIALKRADDIVMSQVSLHRGNR